jgi:integrase
MGSFPTASVVLDTRRSLTNNAYPLKLRVTYKRKQKYYGLKGLKLSKEEIGESIKMSLTEEDFEKACKPKPKDDYKLLKRYFNNIEEKADKIIEVIGTDFSFDEFEQLMLRKTDSGSLTFAFEQKVKDLKKEGRIGTASSYHYALKSLKDFFGKEEIEYLDITKEMLDKHEAWAIGEGKSITTVGIYIRALRAIINEGVEKDLFPIKQYPFGKKKYQIPSGTNTKLALPLEDIKKIFLYKAPPGSRKERSRDMWVFSYLCNGINVRDIARLKYSNIKNDRIVFVRAKTERTSRNSIQGIVAIITDEVKSIINKWGNKPGLADQYIFPILEEGLTPEQELARVKQETKQINKYIDKIAVELKINQKVTSYSARHSYSTILKRSGASIEFISEQLGHKDTKTTRSYLDSFEDDTKREFAKKLTDF